MSKLAVFYHARIAGGSPPLVDLFAQAMVREQMDLLVTSGLYDAANEIFVGLNGDGAGFMAEECPPGVKVIEHGPKAESLLPTFLFIEDWIKSHSDWYVCFWHTKGVTHPGDYLNRVWRRCMEYCVIEKWARCVADLEAGYDSAGAHWLTREQFGAIVNTFFWGGAFYWVKASFLLQLPKLITEVKTREDWFAPEMWIGTGPRPNVRDYAPHWPGAHPCSLTLNQRP